MQVINRAESIRGRFVECERQWTSSKGFTLKLWAFNTRQWLIMSYDAGCGSWKDENWYREIPLLLFIAPLLRLHQTVREHLKNAYLLTKLLSRVTDNCMKTTSSLVRKYKRIQVCRHYLFQNAKFSESETRRKLWASRNKWYPWINLRAYYSAE